MRTPGHLPLISESWVYTASENISLRGSKKKKNTAASSCIIHNNNVEAVGGICLYEPGRKIYRFLMVMDQMALRFSQVSVRLMNN